MTFTMEGRPSYTMEELESWLGIGAEAGKTEGAAQRASTGGSQRAQDGEAATLEAEAAGIDAAAVHGRLYPGDRKKLADYPVSTSLGRIDRSKKSSWIIDLCCERSISAAETLALIRGYALDVAEKYDRAGALAAEVLRVRAKWQERQAGKPKHDGEKLRENSERKKREANGAADEDDDADPWADEAADGDAADDAGTDPLSSLFLNARELLASEPPEREYTAEGVILKNKVFLFTGDGGVGKSKLILQLVVGGALGTDWIGFTLPDAPFKSLVISCEDDRDEMNRRLREIVVDLGGDAEQWNEMDRVTVIDATPDGTNEEIEEKLPGFPALAKYTPNPGANEITDFYTAIKRFVAENGTNLVVIDGLADVYNEETDRHAVRSFIRLLGQIGCTVILIAHPSLEGIRSGRGTSGSTQWHNAVRNRGYMTYLLDESGQVVDENLLELEFAKNQYGRKHPPITLRRRDSGVYVRETTGGNDDMSRQRRKEVVRQRFLRILEEFERTGQTVSPNRSASYAPTVFMKHSTNKDALEIFNKPEFEAAMNWLLSEGAIEIVVEGPPSRQRKHLRIVKQANPEGDEGNLEDEESDPET